MKLFITKFSPVPYYLFFLDPIIRFGTLFSNTLIIFSCNERGHISHPYKTTRETIVWFSIM
jgi:hypothetical protein